MLDRQHITRMFALHLKLHHSSFLSDKICIFQTPLCCRTYVHSHWLQKKNVLQQAVSKKSKFPVIKCVFFFSRVYCIFDVHLGREGSWDYRM